jgi:hypothetical protein
MIKFLRMSFGILQGATNGSPAQLEMAPSAIASLGY